MDDMQETSVTISPYFSSPLQCMNRIMSIATTLKRGGVEYWPESQCYPLLFCGQICGHKEKTLSGYF